MASLEGFDFFPLHAGRDGRITDPSELEALVDHVGLKQTTDLVLLAHGFRNDENAATALYSGVLKGLRSHLSRPELSSLQGRAIAACGIFWPSKTFRESFGEGGVQSAGDDDAEKRDVLRRLEDLRDEAEPEDQKQRLTRAIELLEDVEGSTEAQDELVAEVLSLLDGADIDPTEGLDRIRAHEGSELLALLEADLVLPLTDSAGDEGGVLTVGDASAGGGDGGALGVRSFFGSVFGRIGQLLNVTTWYQMKDRAGKVGAQAAAEAVVAVAEADQGLKIHLVGHSLGGRLVASCARTVGGQGRKLASLTLLQAAFSHFGLSRTRGGNKPGLFLPVIERKVVRGPLVSTFSSRDTVVGHAYAIASRLANDNTEAIGDANDEFGGIGRNGAQNAPSGGSIVEELHAAGEPYSFRPGVIVNLDGSGGLIADHSDVRNPNVTYAVASAIAAT